LRKTFETSERAGYTYLLGKEEIYRILREERKKNMKNRKIDQKTTKQLVVDTGYHELLKVEAAKAHTSIKSFLEGYLGELFEVQEKK
jgi:hypothetical protein